MKYWVYMREDYRIGTEILDLKSIQIHRKSNYSGEPLKYLSVPCTIKGSILEMSDEKLAQAKAEIASLYINPNSVRTDAFELTSKPSAFPVGKLISILPLTYAHERGYLHYPSGDPMETLA